MKIIKKQTGFSLIELMVATAVLGMLALAVSQLTQNQMKAAKTVETKFEFSSIMSDIRTILSDQGSCIATLQGRNAQTTGQGVFTQILRRPDTGPDVVRYQSNTSTAATSTAPRYGAAKVRIHSFALNHALPGAGTNAPTGGEGSTSLIVRFYVGDNKIYSTPFIDQRIVINVTTNGANGIVRCSSTAADNTLQNLELMCSSIGGVFDQLSNTCSLVPYPNPPLSVSKAVSTQHLNDWWNATFPTLDTRYVRKDVAAAETMIGQLVLGGAAGPGGIVVNRGGIAVAAGGVNVTAGGVNVSAGGVNVTAGGVTVSGGNITTSAATAIVVGGSGGVQINAGNLTMAEGQVIQMNSDRKLKYEIKHIKGTLNKIRNLKPASYRWKKTNEKVFGVIAQEVAEVFPELVRMNEETNVLSVDYIQLTPIMLSGIKELDQENAELKNEIHQMKQDIDQLKSYVCLREPSLPVCFKD